MSNINAHGAYIHVNSIFCSILSYRKQRSCYLLTSNTCVTGSATDTILQHSPMATLCDAGYFELAPSGGS